MSSDAPIMADINGLPIEIRNTSDNYAKYIVFPDITLMVSEEMEYINYSTSNHDGSGVTATTASKDQTIANRNEFLKRKSSNSVRSNKKRNSSSKAQTEDAGNTSHDILNESMAGSNTHSVFTAHKERLVYHSQFFRSMFLSERPMSEATANCIPVILPRGTLIAFPSVLKYMYNGFITVDSMVANPEAYISFTILAKYLGLDSHQYIGSSQHPPGNFSHAYEMWRAKGKLQSYACCILEVVSPLKQIFLFHLGGNNDDDRDLTAITALAITDTLNCMEETSPVIAKVDTYAYIISALLELLSYCEDASIQIALPVLAGIAGPRLKTIPNVLNLSLHYFVKLVASIPYGEMSENSFGDLILTYIDRRNSPDMVGRGRSLQLTKEEQFHLIALIDWKVLNGNFLEYKLLSRLPSSEISKIDEFLPFIRDISRDLICPITQRAMKPTDDIHTICGLKHYFSVAPKRPGGHRLSRCPICQMSGNVVSSAPDLTMYKNLLRSHLSSKEAGCRLAKAWADENLSRDMLFDYDASEQPATNANLSTHAMSYPRNENARGETSAVSHTAQFTRIRFQIVKGCDFDHAELVEFEGDIKVSEIAEYWCISHQLPFNSLRVVGTPGAVNIHQRQDMTLHDYLSLYYPEYESREEVHSDNNELPVIHLQIAQVAGKPVIRFYSREKIVDVGVSLTLVDFHDDVLVFPATTVNTGMVEAQTLTQQRTWHLAGIDSTMGQHSSRILFSRLDHQVGEVDYLYWEACITPKLSPLFALNMNTTICLTRQEVLGTEALDLLLAQGLSYVEATEMLTYWLPQLTSKPFVQVDFLPQSVLDKYAAIAIHSNPRMQVDMLRVFMLFRPIDNRCQLSAKSSKSMPKRNIIRPSSDFYVLEWGGMHIPE